MKNFDRWIKSELDQHEASRPDAAWDQFASKLEHAEVQSTQNAQFDRELKTKLEQFQAQYEPSHWQLFRQTLERQARQRADMLRLKVVEAALFLLILLTLWNLNGPEYRPGTTHFPIASLPDTHLILPETTQALQQEMVSVDPLHSSSAQSPSQPSAALADRAPVRMTAPLQVIQAFHPVIEIESSPVTSRQDLESMNTKAGDPVWIDRQIESGVEHLAANQPQLEREPSVDLLTLPVSTKPNIRHCVSMGINGDINYVMTPYDQLLVKKGYDQLVSGYGATMGYSLEGPRWGLRTSLTYHRKYYLPKPYTEVFDGDIQRGYFSETLRDIELNLLSLSVLAQRTFVRVNRWHAYGLIGGTAHLAFQANYDRKLSYTPGADPNPNGITPEPTTESKTSLKRYADGFFEGGSLAENSYLTVDLGVGLERHLTGRTNLFIEPVYQHNPFQKSLGPNKDRINTLSISVGARINL
ncbi:MAG: outer membrane beta-barrel protein [Saprospiraceae bacterium]|nr:outer membrane beta-barrel protein [Saprospiraceae bacterium]